ncbi:MAG: hypothetical protein EPN70_24905 [Paraburkholderia sp.]|uniref:hypothetical protein n=1 Tax=Paraburkholderia sp. TaxID=1926495 RepID=UPI001226B91C|nr:hypothetical protein [Paraburkholderia sp.]TAL99546.1 MAG: hypothetical protein EPN70_24905 [Paraburkholderia sp.]
MNVILVDRIQDHYGLATKIHAPSPTSPSTMRASQQGGGATTGGHYAAIKVVDSRQSTLFDSPEGRTRRSYTTTDTLWQQASLP